MNRKFVATAIAGTLLAAAVASPADARRWRHHHHHRHSGGGAFIGGLAAGAILGGAIASQPRYGYRAPAYDGAVRYCLSRFKSYDPASGTYLGYDGERHPCP